MSPDLPYWLKVLSALGPTMAASATMFVGLMVASIAYRQWRTAHQKLVLDLFDKRFSAYSELRDAASEFEKSQGESLSAFLRARDAVHKAKFLFAGDVMSEVDVFYAALLKYERIPPEVAIYDQAVSGAMIKVNVASLETVRRFWLRMPDIFGPYLQMHQKLTDRA